MVCLSTWRWGEKGVKKGSKNGSKMGQKWVKNGSFLDHFLEGLF